MRQGPERPELLAERRLPRRTELLLARKGDGPPARGGVARLAARSGIGRAAAVRARLRLSGAPLSGRARATPRPRVKWKTVQRSKEAVRSHRAGLFTTP